LVKIYDEILSTVYIGNASQALCFFKETFVFEVARVSPNRWNVMAKSKLIIAKIDDLIPLVWDKILGAVFIGKLN